MGCVVAIPVGPGEREAARAHEAIASVREHEPRVECVVVVADEPQRAFDADEVVANPRTGRGLGSMGPTCAATLCALRWAHAVAPGRWVLRLDADARIVVPFAARVERALAAHPEAGVLGACDHTPAGEPRDFSSWVPFVRKHRRAVTAWRDGRPHVVAAPRVARVVRGGLAAGLEPGRHCVAGGCAVSGAFIGAAAREGLLDDPAGWAGARLGDDVMLGLMAASLGYELRDCEIFGVWHRTLPDAPERLAQRGFAVVHPVK